MENSAEGLVIRAAVPGDSRLILGFIQELAAYEKLAHQVEANEADLDSTLFGDNPRVFCEIADWQGVAVGFALYFYNFSTFQGRHGIWVEDLYVQEHMRGRGIGRRLLESLACRCAREGLGRMEWSVLDWNAPAIAAYRAIGAVPMDEWTVQRLTGEALERLALDGSIHQAMP